VQKTLLASAIVASLAAATGAHAANLPPLQLLQAPLTVTATATSLTYSFSGLSLDGFQFLQVVGPLATGGLTTGTLTSVSVNATLDASVDYTYADDLTIYVDPTPLSTGGLLQVGGFSDLEALERHTWANGGSSAPGTTVIDTVALNTPITFAGSASDPIIWLGNGYGVEGTNGTWSGSITLTISAVPEPSTWALFALGGIGVMGWSAKRRREADRH